MSVAIYNFRMTEDHFWRLTPAKFSALSRRWEAEEETLDFRMAYIISTIVNVNRGKRQRAVKPSDFMPSKLREARKPKTSGQLHAMWRTAMGPRLQKKDGAKTEKRLDG